MPIITSILRRFSLLLLFIILTFSLNAQVTTISSVVTYFFNKNLGDKPDIGAKVYIVDSVTSSTFSYEVIDSFIDAKTYRSFYFTYLDLYSLYSAYAKSYEKKKKYKALYEDYKTKAEDAKRDMDKYYSNLEKLGAETKEKFDSLDKRAALTIMSINDNNSIFKTVA